MKNKAIEIVKEVVVQYTKEHDENKGVILDFLNHLEQSFEILQKLPEEIQNELGYKALCALSLAGLLNNK